MFGDLSGHGVHDVLLSSPCMVELVCCMEGCVCGGDVEKGREGVSSSTCERLPQRNTAEQLR